MPPRKKPNSSTAKKSQSLSSSQTQPTKFGIQHFFQRHTQDSKNVSVSSTPQNSHLHSLNSNPKNASHSLPTQIPLNLSLHNTPPDDTVSPETCKSLPLKRFKFSPGMLIKQSQDDGGDEITWKISPVNKKLQSRVFPNSTELNSSTIRQCCLNQDSTGTADKVEEGISSPTPNSTETSLLCTNKTALKRVKPDQDALLLGSVTNANTTLSSSQHSPFRTPPSLSFPHDKLPNDTLCNGASDHLGFKHHKKALLELLDQVEDAISVEESVSGDMEAYPSKFEDKKSDKMFIKADPPVKRVTIDTSEKVNWTSSNCNFLVLEVSEKCRPSDYFGPKCPYKVLRLLNEQSGEERAVCLQEEWFYSVIAPGDTVKVVGEFDDQGKCDVDHDNHLVIVHPDILVSGTRVAASFNCPRRTILDERLKCCEQSTAALIGTLLHQIFQAGLMTEIPTINFLEEYAGVVLQKNIENLYTCGVNETDIHKTLIEAIPKMLNWIILFKGTKDSKASIVNFGSDNGQKKIKISEVIDIEEMAWAPKYGLKGIIDASIRVETESNRDETNEMIVPLEFKTGKILNGQSSMEHCAQVILYTLLMSERYQKHVDHGLLYYLQSNQTQGIKVRRSDLVGLIMRRNELASDILKASTTQQLPPMLRSPSMCRGCRHLNVCTIYHKAYGGNTESSGLGDIFDSHIHHLTGVHSGFLRHWDRLIDLEAKEMQLVKNEIWQSHSLRGDPLTSCLTSIVLDTKELLHHKSYKDNRFVYRFVCQDMPSNSLNASDGVSLSAVASPANVLDSTLRSGDYVLLSTESDHLTVASGFITDIGRSHVSVSLSKRLRLPGRIASSEAQDLFQEVWRIDKDEVMTSFAVMRFNLVQLFQQSAESSQLRKMIVDLEAPRFDSGCIFSQDPAISYIWSEKNLNDDQRRAILKILTAKDYALILGMPGTGKTSTMVHAVKALLMRGSSILLTSYTNSAVDNLLIKLKPQNIDFVRIGRHEAVHEDIQGHCFSAKKIKSIEEIRVRLDKVKVVAVTCLGITNPLLINKRFDVCIMDEAGQTTLPVSLGPLMFASKFVLVGDHYQLPPLVQSREAQENGMEISLFRRLSEAHPQAISALQSQYRMCRGIMELSNALIYGDRLRCGSPEIADSKIEVSNLNCCSSWLKEVLKPSRPVIFINSDMLGAFERKVNRTLNNPIEALIIAKITEELVNRGIEGKDIGIITPYNSQAKLISHAVSVPSVEIHTIDKFQGRDKECILASLVRCSENPRSSTSSLLGDWHRINVAITRAKKKLIMVGSRATLSKVPLLKLLINKVEEQSGILSPSKLDINHFGDLNKCSNSQSW